MVPLTFCSLPLATHYRFGQSIQAAAEEAYDRTDACTFTSFVGYEHTASLVGRHQHRNVIFRGTEGAAPFSQLDSLRPEDLWSYLEKNRKRGIEAMAIPHNGNVSNGVTVGIT